MASFGPATMYAAAVPPWIAAGTLLVLAGYAGRTNAPAALGVPLEEHIALVRDAMASIAGQLERYLDLLSARSLAGATLRDGRYRSTALGYGGDAPHNWQAYKEIKEATTSPIATGESLFGLEEGFRPFIENRAVDIIHPDLLTSGGMLETKRIADYAERFDMPTALHFAGSPVSCMAGVHIAATLKNFVVMENHAVDMPWWSDLVNGVPKPIVQLVSKLIAPSPDERFQSYEEIDAAIAAPQSLRLSPRWVSSSPGPTVRLSAEISGLMSLSATSCPNFLSSTR